GPGAGGEKDMVGPVDRLDTLVADGELALVADPRLAVDQGDGVFLHQVGDALGQPPGHGAAVGHQLGDVEAHVVDAEAKGGGAVQGVGHLGAPEQRLGGNAAPVEAYAAEVLPFNQGGLEPQLGGADGGHVAAGAAAHHHQV